MKKQLNIKKLILLNLPYILMGLFSTNFGEAWRMAVGADASAKMLSFFSTLPVALASWWPSLHPLVLLPTYKYGSPVMTSPDPTVSDNRAAAKNLLL